MRRTLLTLGIVAAALSAAPDVASAAALALDRGCYLARQDDFAGQRVRVSGAGFHANSAVAFQLNGSPLPTAQANAFGGVDAGFNVPEVPGGRPAATVTLIGSDGTNQAALPLTLTRLDASFTPRRGDPRTQRVRFHVYGFGPLLTALGRPTSQPVYEHVLRPNGRRRATFYAGRTRGPCGELHTTRRRILPFQPENGLWTFVFTTSPRYSPRAFPRALTYYRVRTVFLPGL